MLDGWRSRFAAWASLAFVVAFCAGLTPALHLHVHSHAEHEHRASDCAYCDVILTGATTAPDEPGPVISNEDLRQFAGGCTVAAPVPSHFYEPTAPRGPPCR
jgi:hypothetical protein